MPDYRSYQDDDAGRLPAGLKRVGYDADTETYTYESPEGKLYRGAPGNRYGRLVPDSEPVDNDLGQLVHDDAGSNRYFLPFLLVVIVFLVIFIAPPWKENFGFGRAVKCEIGAMKYEIRTGDTCYALANEYSTTVEGLKNMNSKLNCDSLSVGQALCIPAADVS